MFQHPSTALLFVDDDCAQGFNAVITYFDAMPHMQVDSVSQLPEDLSPWDAVVTATKQAREADVDRLSAYVKGGGGWLGLIPLSADEVPHPFGVLAAPNGASCELRVLFDDRDHPLGRRLPEAIYVSDHYRPLEVKSEDAETILYVDWHFQHSTVLAGRSWGSGSLACTTLQNFTHPVLRQIFYRLIRQLGGAASRDRAIGVGILGYAPSVGQAHGQGAVHTRGLELRAACDLSPERLDQARKDFPDIRTTASAAAMGEDPDIDLIVIATPPNTHARLAMEMISAGKHVVCEKPLALSTAETAAMANAAHRHGVHLSCHQNRRWDVDYRAIQQVLAEGLIGETFYVETFVGGYGHPCGYWHSDAAVSGGTTYDWGAHYIDWIIGLLGGRIASVVGTRHKRVWQDVTNADQERIQLRFQDGREAEFIHSDIAAARKPKWYLLGTRGAIVGNWRDVDTYEIDPVHYFHRHAIPATEMPPELTVYRRHTSGDITALKPAIPQRQLYGFHLNLADHLLTGEPLVAPLKDSMQVVAVLEAAARSMANAGSVETPHGG
jgi:predicted dehydrogenase